MAPTTRLANVAAGLGYGGTEGFVDGTSTEVGARDFVWRDLKDKCLIDAAYFRGAVPLVAFVDAVSEREVRASHRRLWNFGRVPILIASTPDEVMAVSCVTGPSPDSEGNRALLQSTRQGTDVERVLEEFSRFNVESGRVAAAHPKEFDRRKRVDRRLLDNLRRLRTRLLASELAAPEVERLLGRSIFIQYLEDRDILTPEHLQELGAHGTFRETLLAGPRSVRTLFGALSEHFNGDVFTSGVVESDLPKAALRELSEFFTGTEFSSGQRTFWPYDFSVIPPELISSIYEQLLVDSQKKDAAFYTPRHVVDLVLDELVPWSGETAHPTILDPACGSGIFLAEAFRRLVYRHTIANGQPPSYEGLSDLLTSSIFGVDQSSAAIGVSAFGLYLALLEHVDPPTAWREARLPVLVGRNLLISDFFDNHALASRKFDLVVGNPPWKSALSEAAARYVRRHHLKLPDRQMALAFLWRSVDLADNSGTVGLVMPAKALLHNRSAPAQIARQRLFSTLSVETVIDLSPLRRDTFGSAKNPACVVIVQHRAEDERPGPTVHVSPRRTPLADAIDGIVVSQDEIREVPSLLAATSTEVWKAYLWGGPADLSLVERLRTSFPDLKSYARDRSWKAGQGFQASGGGHNDASEIVGMDLLPTDAVEAMRIVEEPTERVVDAVMHRPRNSDLFRGPHVLMRKGFRTHPVSAFADVDLAFTDGLFALTGPRDDARDLQAIAALLNSSLARYWYFMTSSSWGVEREQIQLNEYLSLPTPPLTESLVDAAILAASTAANSDVDDESWLGPLDEAVFIAYRISDRDQDVIRDGLQMRLAEYQKGPESASYEPPTEDDFTTYAQLLAEDLSASGSIPWTAQLAERAGGFAVVVCEAEIGGKSSWSTSGILDRLLRQTGSSGEDWRSPAAVMQPAAIVVDGTSVFLIKADQRRSWTRSTARSDAAEVLGAVLTASTTDES